MWIPLHVHSQYSILDATPSVEAIANRAKEFQLPACALTDHGNLHGAVEFYKACTQNGVKPIIGCEVYVAPHSRFEKKKEYGSKTAFHLTLLAKNMTGYKNLCKLSSVGYLEGFYYHPRIDKQVLEAHKSGLICLSGCLSSKISFEALHGTSESFFQEIEWHKNVFGDDFYLELQRHPMSEQDLRLGGMYQESWLLQQHQEFLACQKKVNNKLIEAATTFGIKLVATNDSHYMEKEDWRAHEILLNIQSGEPVETWERDLQGNPKFRIPNPKRRTYASHELYFKSPDEMVQLFSDLPQCCQNTLEVAAKCDLALDFKSKHYPVFVPPELEGKTISEKEREKEVEKFLLKLCEEGIGKRYTPERLAKVKELFPNQDPMDVVRNRLSYEMNVIAPKGMCDYLLIVWDFIHWAKSNGIPMGPGRGSGAGSIVLYLIGVTDIEPLRFHLFFERFINPERISYPDIDVDICMDRRDQVIQYILTKYGKENVAQIITFGTMKAKMVIRDVGRVLSVPLSKVNEICKLVPEELNITLKESVEKDPDLRQMVESDDETKRIFDVGLRLEGSIRSTGTHAAGVIIAGEPLVHLIPICVAKDTDMPVTQYSMKPVEMVGMLKMDFLGLKTLTAIQIAVDAVKAKGEIIDWVNLPLDDKRAFDLLNQGKTLGVFQLESGGMQDLARNLHLDKFEEIIAVGALYRPGPMDMIPTFINRKHGREKIEYDHPWMKEILAETYGIMVYQEQVMQIASRLAKYSLGEGDVLRRAMGKKDAAQMAKERVKFTQGCSENGISQEIAGAIFDKMEKFAAYGFNKSHAAAYGYLAYVTAYLKAHHPKEWMAALMSCDSADISKVAKFIREAKTMGIEILPPDVNEAGREFSASRDGIRFAMSGIKGVGEAVVEAVVEDRAKKGSFKSLYDFIKRLGTQKLKKNVLEFLVAAGSFDFTGWSRDALALSIEPICDVVAKELSDEKVGALDLFAAKGKTSEKQFLKPPEVKIKTSHLEALMKEKSLLGLFLTGHPMDAYKDLLARLSCVPLRQVEGMEDGAIFRSAVIVETVQVRFSAKTQKKFAILNVSDGVETFELPIWPDLYEQKHPLLRENQLLYAVLQLEKVEGAIRLSCKWFDDLTQANDEMVRQCDAAYDRAKQMASRFSRRSFVKKEEVVKPQDKLVITLDGTKTRISHILKLQEIFSHHRGKIPIEIDFAIGGAPYAKLHLKSGLEQTPELEKKLKALPEVVSVSGF
jgi:DNA polymerase-3 subunit alpha